MEMQLFQKNTLIFFVNKKNAKSADMKSLISFVKKTVKDHTGVKLELEIVVVE